MRAFLDSEFTDENLHAELVSLALVSDGGACELYLSAIRLPERFSARASPRVPAAGSRRSGDPGCRVYVPAASILARDLGPAHRL